MGCEKRLEFKQNRPPHAIITPLVRLTRVSETLVGEDVNRAAVDNQQRPTKITNKDQQRVPKTIFEIKQNIL